MHAMPGLLILVPFVWIALVFAFGAWRRARSGKPMVPRIPPGATFGETACSGRALGGLRRLSGANNCLIVSVDQSRLNVALAFPFSLFPMPGPGALEVDVPLSEIARVTPGRRLWQDVLTIEFVDTTRPGIELVLRDEAGFVAALGSDLARRTQQFAPRPLRQGKAGPRLGARIGRVFVCIWGVGALVGSGIGLSADLTVRAHGVATTGVLIAFQGKQGIVRYRVDGVDYTMISNSGRGTWVPGQTETIYYLRNDPAHAIEGGSLPFLALFALAGLITLAFGVFGPRLIPGWS